MVAIDGNDRDQVFADRPIFDQAFMFLEGARPGGKATFELLPRAQVLLVVGVELGSFVLLVPQVEMLAACEHMRRLFDLTAFQPGLIRDGRMRMFDVVDDQHFVHCIDGQVHSLLLVFSFNPLGNVLIGYPVELELGIRGETALLGTSLFLGSTIRLLHIVVELGQLFLLHLLA